MYLEETGCGLDSYGLGQGVVAGFCEHHNELLGPIEEGEFLDKMSYCQLVKKISVPWSLYLCSIH
jgi:hypothetical protein